MPTMDTVSSLAKIGDDTPLLCEHCGSKGLVEEEPPKLDTDVASERRVRDFVPDYECVKCGRTTSRLRAHRDRKARIKAKLKALGRAA